MGYQTRTERIATDIDSATHDLVQLDPAEDVRTGGDSVPWDDTAAGDGARVPYGDPGDHPLNEAPPRPPGRRRDRSTIPVEPGEPGPAPVVERGDAAFTTSLPSRLPDLPAELT